MNHISHVLFVLRTGENLNPGDALLGIYPLPPDIPHIKLEVGHHFQHSDHRVLQTVLGRNSEFAAVHRRYVMDACDHVQSIILLPRMVGNIDA